ncbi:hypothetical protein BCR33DRAFT_788154 [Rhizoclosmatium globosum]|uniref:Secreted protein n=1 Tax=Rhizoclosmatium globosum TaxID=329046 RepID=A0A1Y2BXM8_9FUNG|nr:hypothetical protein BCR33DRAFT_788154 [Rhizoclosmatium globosum]|eukprot:ORY39511.1 hypothetical protein BCR33DRAFT_788154 [Rhizoclosmatium globosum]
MLPLLLFLNTLVLSTYAVPALVTSGTTKATVPAFPPPGYTPVSTGFYTGQVWYKTVSNGAESLTLRRQRLYYDAANPVPGCLVTQQMSFAMTLRLWQFQSITGSKAAGWGMYDGRDKGQLQGVELAQRPASALPPPKRSLKEFISRKLKLGTLLPVDNNATDDPGGQSAAVGKSSLPTGNGEHQVGGFTNTGDFVVPTDPKARMLLNLTLKLMTLKRNFRHYSCCQVKHCTQRELWK